MKKEKSKGEDILKRSERYEIEAEQALRTATGGVKNSTLEQGYFVTEPVLSAYSSDQELIDQHLAVFTKAIGVKSRGNTRVSVESKALYWELTFLFLKFRQQGITLPRWHISKVHIQRGLLDVLKKHFPDSYGHLTETKVLNSSQLRNEIHHARESVFRKIIESINSYK